MPPLYSGSLPPKKKSELQEIALELRISDQGTKDDLVQRITRHLDIRQDELEDHPTFTGLYGRRKRSIQPQPLLSLRLAPLAAEKPRPSARRPIISEPEITPAKDREVSIFSQRPLSPVNEGPIQSSDAIASPVSPPASPAKILIGRLQHPVQSVVHRFREQEILQSGNELVISLRTFMSNSRNIWFVAAIFELFYILLSIIPWQNLEISLAKDQRWTITLHYPPLVVFQTSTFWFVLLHWSLPTLIIPVFIGCMITFNPALAPTKSANKGFPVAPLDPLTASIIRLAAHISYPYSLIASQTGIVGLDVLSPNWRILSASVCLAFAFAEAIAGAPLAAVK